MHINVKFILVFTRGNVLKSQKRYNVLHNSTTEVVYGGSGSSNCSFNDTTSGGVLILVYKVTEGTQTLDLVPTYELLRLLPGLNKNTVCNYIRHRFPEYQSDDVIKKVKVPNLRYLIGAITWEDFETFIERLKAEKNFAAIKLYNQAFPEDVNGVVEGFDGTKEAEQPIAPKMGTLVLLEAHNALKLVWTERTAFDALGRECRWQGELDLIYQKKGIPNSLFETIVSQLSSSGRLGNGWYAKHKRLEIARVTREVLETLLLTTK